MVSLNELFAFDQTITPLTKDPVRWIVITEKEALDEIIASLPLPLLKQQPSAIIAVVSNHKLSIIKDSQSYWQIATGILLERLRAKAITLELDPKIIFSFDPEKVSASIKLPRFLYPLALVILTKPIEKTTPFPAHVHWNIWEPEH